MGVLTRQKLDHINAKPIGAFVKKREREILLPRLLRGVLRHRATRGIGHFLHAEVKILAQSANTVRHLFDIRLH